MTTPEQSPQQSKPPIQRKPYRRLYSGMETVATIFNVIGWLSFIAGFLLIFEDGMSGSMLIGSGMLTITVSGIWMLLCDLGQRLQARGFITN
ncbi:hypothetical protein [Corynebacterium rouxii]|uniref:YrhK domain-containing protein n=1 Tax=Corynebacterium rouxii TaxID=2719119 RepID=A0A6I8MBF4_9CORY|nr:hypothetical protein [Corynebacterium rouxii]VZH84150.1 hypothetical protein FRC0190_00189 [Corynebacterium rouxii]